MNSLVSPVLLTQNCVFSLFTLPKVYKEFAGVRKVKPKVVSVYS